MGDEELWINGLHYYSYDWEARAKEIVSLHDLASALGVSLFTLSHVNGAGRPWGHLALKAAAKSLGIDPDVLIAIVRGPQEICPISIWHYNGVEGAIFCANECEEEFPITCDGNCYPFGLRDDGKVCYSRCPCRNFTEERKSLFLRWVRKNLK